MTGIYCIQNVNTGKKYIGSSCDCHHRWHQHQTDLGREVHRNCYLQRAWKKYGKEMFTFTVLEICTKKELEVKEAEWIKKLDTVNRDRGYNLTYRTDGRNHDCETTREKRRAACTKQWESRRKSMIAGIKASWINPSERRIAGPIKSGQKRRDNRPVIAKDMAGVIVGQYKNRRAAFLAHGNNRNVYKVLDGKNKTTCGLIFEYA